ncbi:MAG: hypothetical protein B6I36_06610 [Desulfobacteraceae bacterium 4572_35.1]|nr:MAG: hypothetical protein B6I36_06610 [Desulfobacteraceae bacterium 4572_35.1]
MKFRIRKTFLFPLGFLVVELVALLISCIVFKQPPAKAIILAVMILPVIVLFIECLFRNTTIGDDHITMRKLLRIKRLNFADISSIETIMVKRRAFVTLSTNDDFLIFSNAYSGFPIMVQHLLTKLPAEVVTEEAVAMAEKAPNKSADMVSCWLAVLVVGFILYAQLMMGQ